MQMNKINHLIYFYNKATTLVEPSIMNVIPPFLKYIFANTYSSHCIGLSVKVFVKTFRMQVAELILAEAFGPIKLCLLTYYTKEEIISTTWSIKGTVTNQYNHA